MFVQLGRPLLVVEPLPGHDEAPLLEEPLPLPELDVVLLSLVVLVPDVDDDVVLVLLSLVVLVPDADDDVVLVPLLLVVLVPLPLLEPELLPEPLLELELLLPSTQIHRPSL